MQMEPQVATDTTIRTHWLLNLSTLLLIYAHIKESLQFPPVLTLIPSFVSIYKWAAPAIVPARHFLRLSYILPTYFLVVFSFSLGMAIKN